MKKVLRVGVLVAVFLGVFLFQQLSSKLAVVVAEAFDYTAIDPDGAFMKVTVHHITQALLACIVVVIFIKAVGLDFYLKPVKDKTGIRIVLWFTLLYGIITVILDVVLCELHRFYICRFPLNTRNVIGSLSFQWFITGPGEELIFRALTITVLLYFLKKYRYSAAISVFTAAFFFALAHVEWHLAPFQITYDLFQVLLSFTLGLLYGITYLKTKSVIYPMLLHSISNVIVVGIGYVIQIIYT